MKQNNLQKGNILLAEPSLTGDVSFSRAVVLLAEHSENGSVGFILNKPLNYTLNELVDTIQIPFPVYNGGPVEQDNLYFIHSLPHLIKGSVEISDGIYWGGNFETLSQAINNNEVSKNDIRFFLGYSGWNALQLREEIKSQSWIPIQEENLKKQLTKCTVALWKEKLTELGGEYLIWSNTPDNPNLN